MTLTFKGQLGELKICTWGRLMKSTSTVLCHAMLCIRQPPGGHNCIIHMSRYKPHWVFLGKSLLLNMHHSEEERVSPLSTCPDGRTYDYSTKEQGISGSSEVKRKTTQSFKNFLLQLHQEQINELLTWLCACAHLPGSSSFCFHRQNRAGSNKPRDNVRTPSPIFAQSACCPHSAKVRQKEHYLPWSRQKALKTFHEGCRS